MENQPLFQSDFLGRTIYHRESEDSLWYKGTIRGVVYDPTDKRVILYVVLHSGPHKGKCFSFYSFSPQISFEPSQAIVHLISCPKSIDMIRTIREHLGLGLKESKELVDRMSSGYATEVQKFETKSNGTSFTEEEAERFVGDMRKFGAVAEIAH